MPSRTGSDFSIRQLVPPTETSLRSPLAESARSSIDARSSPCGDREPPQPARSSRPPPTSSWTTPHRAACYATARSAQPHPRQAGCRQEDPPHDLPAEPHRSGKRPAIHATPRDTPSLRTRPITAPPAASPLSPPTALRRTTLGTIISTAAREADARRVASTTRSKPRRPRPPLLASVASRQRCFASITSCKTTTSQLLVS